MSKNPQDFEDSPFILPILPISVQDSLNMETASLRDELTTINLALESQSAELAELKQFRDKLQVVIRRQQAALEKIYLLTSDANMSVFRHLTEDGLGLDSTSLESPESESGG